jgi:hypothetical protein
MKSILGLVLLIASMFAQHAPTQNMFTPDQIQYGPVPAFLPAGAQLAVLEGDPTASTGDFTVRLKMPNGYRIPPHWHPNRENATVILGNFEVGMGDTFNESKMMTLGAGSFGYMDPSMHHYVKASGDVISPSAAHRCARFRRMNDRRRLLCRLMLLQRGFKLLDA